MRRALLSVSDKSGVAELGRDLARRGFELVSTGGTASALAAAGLRVVGVSEVTGFPEMMDGRVKTLHPLVHGGILARRDRPADLEAAAAHGIRLIDLVVVNLYPFAEAAQRPETTFEELVEQIDIGGPSLVRAAAKNFRDVLVVVEPKDYADVVRQLDRPDGPALEFRLELARKAFAHTAQYDGMIYTTLVPCTVENGRVTRGGEMPRTHKRQDLRYGENPHQKASWGEGIAAIRPATRWQVHQGKELSYTNLLDLDAAARIVLEFTEPAAAVIKHTNPCGVATGAGATEAYTKARDADALSAFGGIVGLNQAIEADVARELTSTFIEAVIAPAVSEDAKAILSKKANLRVVTADLVALDRLLSEFPQQDMRSFLGGMLMQERDRVSEAREPWPQAGFPKVVTKRPPTADEWTALRFAWRVCAHVKSNAVIFTSADRTLAIGAGQMSRVDAVKVAVMKGGALTGSVAASDAFFPFRDGLDAVAAAGATAVVQPGGSVRDAEVIAAADEHGLAMVFTGRRHFRH